MAKTENTKGGNSKNVARLKAGSKPDISNPLLVKTPWRTHNTFCIIFEHASTLKHRLLETEKEQTL